MRYLLLFLIACIVIHMSGCATFSNPVKDCGNICKTKTVRVFIQEDMRCECEATE